MGTRRESIMGQGDEDKDEFDQLQDNVTEWLIRSRYYHPDLRVGMNELCALLGVYLLIKAKQDGIYFLNAWKRFIVLPKSDTITTKNSKINLTSSFAAMPF